MKRQASIQISDNKMSPNEHSKGLAAYQTNDGAFTRDNLVYPGASDVNLTIYIKATLVKFLSTRHCCLLPCCWSAGLLRKDLDSPSKSQPKYRFYGTNSGLITLTPEPSTPSCAPRS